MKLKSQLLILAAAGFIVAFFLVFRETRIFRYKLERKLDSLYSAGDYGKAYPLARLEALAGNHRAEYYLGLMYELGQGVTGNFGEAVRWYRKADSEIAVHRLGLMYQRRQDYEQALIWYRRAAEMGGRQSQMALAMMYQTGLGVAKDYAEAYRWYYLVEAGSNIPPQFSHLEKLRRLMTTGQLAEAQKRIEAYKAAHPGKTN